MKQKLHQLTEGFQTAASQYQRGRPSFPKAAIDFLNKELKISSYTKILDVAAGTGKFTQALVKHTPAYVSAVEPVMAMREEFRKALPQVPVMEGTAEHLPMEDASVDIVTVAQAFHWFDRPQALKDIHRVLKPHGALVMVWNHRDTHTPWVKKLDGILDRYYENHPYQNDIDWKKEVAQSKLFEPLKTHELPHVLEYTPQMLLDRVASMSSIAILPATEKTKVLDQVQNIIDSEIKGKETFPFPHTVEILWTHSLKS